jgi:aspartyl-tRNA(Asn)/glutamyl-tRNA(Gln) amidotransferase subunit B
MNRAAVDLAMRAAMATDCTIHDRSIFARKNYFYPDLPKGYQISQFEQPLATGGSIGGIRIRRIHLEEDAGKLIHAPDASLVDLNRAGVPLIEVVSEPDIRSAAEADAYLTRLRQILMYAEVCDGNMEEGSLRCDANVSVRRPGEPLATRTEVKNLNSFRFLRNAIEFEIRRQIAVLEEGGRVVQETRLFDVASGETRVMRSKEEAHDYRYFPEPDLFTLMVERSWMEDIAKKLPEMPHRRAERYQQIGITAPDAEALVATRELSDYFEAVVAASGNAKVAANWVRNEVLRVFNETGSFRISAENLGGLIAMIGRGAIGGKVAKEVFDEMAAGGEPPETIVERHGLSQIVDPAIIRQAAERVIESNPAQVTQYRGGKTQVFGFLVGQLMKETRGKAKAELANEILRGLLDAS